MNKLYLHIGTPKTASTTIQFFLGGNRDVLLKAGYDFPDIKAEFPNDNGYMNIHQEESAFANGNAIWDAYGRTCYESGEEAFNDFCNHIFSDLVELVRDKHSKNRLNMKLMIEYLDRLLEKNNIIISSENLWTIDYGYLRMLREALGDRIVVIVYLRRQDTYIESLWNEVIKLSVETRSIDDYIVGKITDIYDIAGIHYYTRLKEIISIVGRENVLINPFEKELFKDYTNGIVGHFLSLIGIDYDKYDWKKCQQSHNEHIPGNSVHYKRIFNEIILKKNTMEECNNYSSEIAQKYEKVFYNIGSGTNLNAGHIRESYLIPEQRKLLLNYFYNDNRLIAQEIFKSDSTSIFRDMEWNIQCTVPPLTQREADMFRLFYEFLDINGLL